MLLLSCPLHAKSLQMCECALAALPFNIKQQAATNLLAAARVYIY